MTWSKSLVCEAYSPLISFSARMQSFQIALLLLLFTNAQDITFDPNSVDLTTKSMLLLHKIQS